MGAVIEYFNPLVVLLGGLSLPVKMAWGAWLVWGLGQIAWHLWTADDSRMLRTTAATPRQSGVRQSSVRQSAVRQSGVRPVAVRPPSTARVPASAPSVAPYGTSDFIAALDEEQAALGPVAVPSDNPSPYR